MMSPSSPSYMKLPKQKKIGYAGKNHVTLDTGVLSKYHVLGSDEGYEGQQISREGETEDTLDLKFKTTEDNPKIITIQELIMEQYPYNPSQHGAYCSCRTKVLTRPEGNVSI